MIFGGERGDERGVGFFVKGNEFYISATVAGGLDEKGGVVVPCRR